MKIDAVIFDLAGTVVDWGSTAPLASLSEAFSKSLSLNVPDDILRKPMGKAKRVHISDVLSDSDVQAQFERLHGHASSDADVDAAYQAFLAIQLQTLQLHCELIPGASHCINTLKSRGVKVGCTTGYSRDETDIVLQHVQESGVEFDVSVSSSEIDPQRGRPFPDMVLLCAQGLQLSEMSHIVVVDDTVVGLKAGKAAGCTTVGVVDSSIDPHKMKTEGASFADHLIRDVSQLIELLDLMSSQTGET
eukprot:ANDGO_01732.mRNA.1 Phosphonoacetaldehyde hydrolase